MRPLDSSVVPPEVVGVVLYGSRARGDHDAASDTDICVLTSDIDFEKLLDTKKQIAPMLLMPQESIAIYTAQTLRAMSQCGALLLWHLKLEGQVLFERGDFVRGLFESLLPFHRYAAELEEYEGLLSDVREAIAIHGGVTELDLHVLQVVVRNVSILLTVYGGTPSFGRVSAVRTAVVLFPNVPIDMGRYLELCDWHLRFTRGTGQERHLPDSETCRVFLEMAEGSLRFTRRMTC